MFYIPRLGLYLLLQTWEYIFSHIVGFLCHSRKWRLAVVCLNGTAFKALGLIYYRSIQVGCSFWKVKARLKLRQRT